MVLSLFRVPLCGCGYSSSSQIRSRSAACSPRARALTKENQMVTSEISARIHHTALHLDHAPGPRRPYRTKLTSTMIVASFSWDMSHLRNSVGWYNAVRFLANPHGHLSIVAGFQFVELSPYCIRWPLLSKYRFVMCADAKEPTHSCCLDPAACSWWCGK